MGWASTEKNALADTLRRTEPTAPTLCTGWDTRRLLAHLVQREQDLPGGFVDAIQHPAPGEEPRLGRLAEPAATPEGYASLIDRFLEGAPRWSPLSWASDQINLVEYVIHHEDVRRTDPAARPRDLPLSQARQVWRQLAVLARLRLRRSPVAVTLALPSGEQKVVRSGEHPVVLTGEPVELALYASGRRAAAQVQVSGPPASVEAFQAWVATT